MIQINLLRISTDSLYLEFSIECPSDYYFNKLHIKKYEGNNIWGSWLDASSVLLDINDPLTKTSKKVIRISVDAFNGSGMFQVIFGVTSDTNAVIIDDALGICSDINNVYFNLLDLIQKLNGCTTCDANEELMRNYMFLYGHIEAMRLFRIEDAQYFYDIIVNEFTNCGSDQRVSGVINKPCNCN